MGCNWWPCDRNFISRWKEDINVRVFLHHPDRLTSDKEYRYKVACLIKYRLVLCTTTSSSGPPCWPFAEVHISFYFLLWREKPSQHVSWDRGILTSLSCSANTLWLLCGTTLSVICPPESPLHVCHRGRWSRRSWRGQKRKWIILTVSSANTTSAL